MVRKRQRVESTDDWGQLEFLLRWPEQREYELIRPIVVERARETGAASESTLLSRYEVEYLPGSSKLRGVSRPTLFETPIDGRNLARSI